MNEEEMREFFETALTQVVLPEVRALHAELDQLLASYKETLRMMKAWRRRLTRRQKELRAL
jgi:hypothetical protein